MSGAGCLKKKWLRQVGTKAKEKMNITVETRDFTCGRRVITLLITVICSYEAKLV